MFLTYFLISFWDKLWYDKKDSEYETRMELLWQSYIFITVQWAALRLQTR